MPRFEGTRATHRDVERHQVQQGGKPIGAISPGIPKPIGLGQKPIGAISPGVPKPIVVKP